MKKVSCSIIILLITCIFFASCETAADKKNQASKQTKARIKKEPSRKTFHTESGKAWLSSQQAINPEIQHLVCSINRMDVEHLKKKDSIIVPDDLSGDLEFYLPFPGTVGGLKAIRKIIFFSYPTQSFGAYENGELVYTGVTNMGRKKDPTPAGLYYTNWKAEQTTSTFNDEWDLKWNFNIENKEGIGWHEYAMPGYPASHSCLRLLEKDAKYLYKWADEWRLKGDSVLRKGTPVIVFGSYNFDRPGPWVQLLKDPGALRISETAINSAVSNHLDEILAEQKKDG